MLIITIVKGVRLMIKAEGLTKRFDGFTALNGINCDIPKSCVYGIGAQMVRAGPLLRLISGIPADGGSITIDEAGRKSPN